MIVFGCECGKELKARDELAGKKTRCPACQAVLRIPPAPAEVAHHSIPILEADDDDESSPYDLAPTAPRPVATRPVALAIDDEADDEPAAPSTYRPAPQAARPMRFGERPAATATVRPAPAKPKARSATAPRAIKDSQAGQKSWFEYSYFVLLLALVPLMFSLLGAKDEGDLRERFERTIAGATPEEQRRIAEVAAAESVSDDEQIAALPGGRLVGAHLPRNTSAHWVYAAVAAVAYLSLLYFCFSVERTNPLYLIGIGAFTATVGIAFLLFVQFCSHFQIIRLRGGVAAIIFIILAIIGWSYSCANDPSNGFLLSAIGFTVGVGLCEEFTKAIPMFFAFRRQCEFGWRTACLWGLASGIGFGVAEGVIYSIQHYNGVAGVDAYLVRFISCVALHSMWSAAVGIAIARNLDEYEGVDDAPSFGLFMLKVMAGPMVLHGLYDTLLKKEMPALALLVALLSFAWLAFQVEAARAAQPGAGRPRVAPKWAY